MSGWSPCRRHPTLGIPVPPACRKMIDRGALVAGLTTEDVFRVIRDADQSPHWIKDLEREVRELRQANEILKKASAYFAQAELDRPFRK